MSACVSNRHRLARAGFVIPMMAILLGGGEAGAAVPADNSLEVFRTGFEALTAYSGAISAYASRLFIALFVIEFVISAGRMALSGSNNIATFMSFMTFRLLLAGIFWFFLQQGANLAMLVVDFFRGAAQQAGGMDFAVTVTDVMERGILTATAMTQSSSIWSPISSSVVWIAALIIVIMFALLSGVLFTVLMEFYIISIAGVALLAFGGATPTRDIALSYFRFAIASGFKIFVLQIIVSFGVDVLDGWLVDLREDNVQTLTIISVVFVLWYTARTVPDIAGRMIHGTSLGSTYGASPYAHVVQLGQNYRQVANLVSAMKANTSAINTATKAGAARIASPLGGDASFAGRSVAAGSRAVGFGVALAGSAASGHLFARRNESNQDRALGGQGANPVPGPDQRHSPLAASVAASDRGNLDPVPGEPSQ